MLLEAYFCLALNIYHEARGHPSPEQVAVASVVMNRVADQRFPDTVCGVVLQGGEARRDRCQFSWYCDGRSDHPYEAAAWDRAQNIATLVLNASIFDPTDGALFYHAPSVHPSWADSMTETLRDRAHIFYRPEGL